MIALTGGGLTLDSAIDAQPPADWPTTMTLFGTMRFRVLMYSMIQRLSFATARPASRKLGLLHLPTLEKNAPLNNPASGDFDGGCAVGTRGRHHHVAAAREPHGGVAKFHQRKEAALHGIERHAVIHDRQREGTIADRPHHIGNGRQGQWQRPHLFLQSRLVIGRSERGGHDGHRDDQEPKQRHALHPVSGVRAFGRSLRRLSAVTLIWVNAQPAKVKATMIGPSTVRTTLPTA